jgi:integrase/recombinase XerD
MPLTVVRRSPSPAKASPAAATVVRHERCHGGLAYWFEQYLVVEAASGAANTYLAKRRDLNHFLAFFEDRLRSDAPDDWTKSVTAAFLRSLENANSRKPTTVNRTLASLRHCAAWIHDRRPFLAGNPCRGIRDLSIDEPAWKGLSELEVMRLRAAAEQLAHIKTRKNQHGLRDQAIFLVLLHSGLRVSELLALKRSQYTGRHFVDVRRKGKVRTAKVYLPAEARDVLDAYLKDTSFASDSEQLFPSRSGVGLARQHVDRLLRQIARHASAKLPEKEHIRLSAHVLRHTMLRRVTEKNGVQFAMEAAGHASSKYIWRYVKPSDDEKENALDDLF